MPVAIKMQRLFGRERAGPERQVSHRKLLDLEEDRATAGLDPLLQAETRKLIRETAADGRTVFLSSHSLDEVQAAADRIGIIRAGRLIDVDAVESLRERSLRHVAVRFAEPVDASELGTIEGVRIVDVDGAVVRLSATETAMDPLVKAVARHRIVDLVAEPADLEEIFLQFYREASDAG